MLALPVEGYGAAPLLRGLGSVALPAVSGASLVMSAPLALTAGSLAYGIYDSFTGDHRPAPLTPE